MIKMIVTKAVISKGYDGAPAFRYTESAENPTSSSVRFRIGMMVYDKKAEKQHRFVNISVKAFGYLVDRIKNMKLDAGSYVNIIGRYDEENWEDQTTHEKKSAPVLIIDDIEYGDSNGNSKQNGEQNGAPAPNGDGQPQSAGNGQLPDNFTGFEGFGGSNPYFPEDK